LALYKVGNNLKLNLEDFEILRDGINFFIARNLGSYFFVVIYIVIFLYVHLFTIYSSVRDKS